jgi:pimeloyl-ACP methyl ester carboxylesterase
MNAFRNPAMEAGIAAMGFETFYTKTFGSHADLALVSEEEKAAYLADWSAPGALTAMLNWYRASEILVPTIGAEVELPAWTYAPFPHLKMPTLVIWGLNDKALLPVQLDGLDAVIDDLRIAATPDAGHFIPWEYPEFVVSAIGDFMRETT